MRTKAALASLTPPARTYAQLEFIHATAFCTWLAEHDHRPTELNQVDLDHYYTALKIGHRQSLRGFLNWSMTSHNLPRLTFAPTRFTTGEALTQTQRLDLLRHLVTDHDGADGDGPLRMRVAALHPAALRPARHPHHDPHHRHPHHRRHRRRARRHDTAAR